MANSTNKTSSSLSSEKSRPVSPCQAVCKFDDDDVCMGCFRQRNDVDNWFYLDDERKWQIIEEVKPLIAEAKLNNIK